MGDDVLVAVAAAVVTLVVPRGGGADVRLGGADALAPQPARNVIATAIASVAERSA